MNLLSSLQGPLAGRYRLERELGRGGMAIVFLAEDLKHQRQVAIKVLRPDLAASVGRDRFLREITLAAGLQHPHILPLHDSGAIEADGETLLYLRHAVRAGPVAAAAAGGSRSGCRSTRPSRSPARC